MKFENSDGDVIQKLIEENRRLRKENEELRRKLENIQREFEEYKMRHPETVGVKHGKPYIIKNIEFLSKSQEPGARLGHEPHNRPMPQHIDEVRTVSVAVCPNCNATDLSEKVQEIRTHTFDEVPICIYRPHVVNS